MKERERKKNSRQSLAETIDPCCSGTVIAERAPFSSVSAFTDLSRMSASIQLTGSPKVHGYPATDVIKRSDTQSARVAEGGRGGLCSPGTATGSVRHLQPGANWIIYSEKYLKQMDVVVFFFHVLLHLLFDRLTFHWFPSVLSNKAVKVE